MNRGEGKLWIIALIAIVVAGIGTVVIMGPIYQRKWKFTNEMEDALRTFDKSGEEGMFEYLLAKAKELDMPPLEREDFEFEAPEVGSPAWMDVVYYETYTIPGLAPREMEIYIKVDIAKLPPRPF